MLCGRRHKENGNDNWYTAVTQFNKTAINGTKLYYTKTLEGSTWSTSTWNGWAVISDANKWNNGNFDGWSGAGWCSAYRGDQSFNGTSTYLLIPTSTAKSKTINVDTYSDYKGLNKSQTLYKYTSTDNGTSYSEVSINSGTVTISAYKMTGNGTASNDGNTATIDASSTSTSIDAVYTSEVTLTAQACDGYKFNGWYDVETGGTALSTYTSYTYTAANETKTIYARFIQTAEETNDVTISYMCGSESIKAAETVTKVGEETTTKVTAATIPFYTFSGWELGTGVTSTDDLSASSINIKTLSTGDYTLTANYTAIPTSTVYLVNNSDWTEVYAYGWDGTKGETPAWPGAEITANKLAEKYEGYDVYSYKVEVGSYGKVIFNNGSGKQTATFDWTDGKYYYAVDPLGSDVFLAGSMTNWGTDKIEFKKATAEGTTASVTVNLTAGTYQFKLIISGSWKGNTGTMKRGGDAVHEGGWSFAEEGGDDKNCKLVADFAGDYTFTWDLTTKKLTVAYPELPTYTVTATAENGTVTGAGDYKHGTEVTLVATPNTGYAFVNWKKGEEVVSSEASYTFTVTANTDLVATFAPEETHEVTVSYICNSNPIPGHAATTLAVGVTTPSTITAPAITNYTFNGWTLGTGVQSEDKTANPIQITTLAEGEYTLVANYTKIELTYTVKVPEGTEKCYIAGDMNSWSFQEMTPTANANEFTITIDGATTAHKYKYTCGPAWAFVEKQANGAEVDNRTYNANDVVAKWADPLATNVYLAGSFTDWDNNKIQFKKATHDAKTATVTVELSEANTTYEFKIVNDGSWLGNTGTIVESVNGWTFPNGDDNCKITTTYAGYYTFTWNLEAADQQLSVAYPVPSAEDITVPNLSKTEVNRGFGTPFTLLEDLVNYEYTFTIDNYKGGAFVYGSEFKITGDINGLSATGLGTWNVVDGIETLTAQLYAYDENGHYLYNVTATTGATTTTPIECMNATYTIDPELNEVTITGVADSKDLTILISPMFEGGYWAEGTWGDVTIYGESFEFDNSDQNEYYVGGTFIDDDNNVYDVVVFAYPDIKTVQITEGQNALTIAANNGKTVNAEVTRQFTTGNLYTIALPFTLENVSSVFGNLAYEYTSLAKDGEDVVLYFSKVNTIEAGKPYLIEPTQDVPGFTAENVTLTSATQSITFSEGTTGVTMEPVVSVGASATTAGKYWLAADRYLYNNENTLKSLRALFTISSAGGIAPRVRVALDENGETALDNITTGETTVKAIVNGQLIIIRDGEMYNAMGVRL